MMWLACACAGAAAETPDIAWKAVLGPRDLTAPAVADNIVVFGERTSTGRLTAVDARNGKTVWQVVVGQMTGGPTILGGVVYGSGNDPGPDAAKVFAKNLKTGKELWHRDVYSYRDGQFLAAADGAIYLVVGGDFMALDAQTGKTRWTYRISPRVDPAVHELRQQVGSVALDDRLRARIEGAQCQSHPVVAGGTVYVVASPARIPDSIASVADGLSGAARDNGAWLVALDAETGREKWRARPVSTLAAEKDMHCLGQPMLAEGLVITKTNWTIYALDAGTGKERWRTVVPPRNREAALRGEFLPSLTVASGVVIARHGGLHAYQISTGEVAWQRSSGSEQAATAGGILYYTGADDTTPPARKGISFIYALDLGSQRILWKREVDPDRTLWKRPAYDPMAESRAPDFLVPAEDGLYYATTDGLRGILVKLK